MSTMQIARIGEIARRNGGERARSDRAKPNARASGPGRKAAFPAMGRLAPDMICMDGTIPRHALPEVLARMSEMSEEYRLGFCNVFHAGDGNLHPLIIFDVMKEGELERAEAFGADILRLCVEVGGVLTGEHGVGVEKRDLMPDMFSEADLAQQHRLKCAFDARVCSIPARCFRPFRPASSRDICMSRAAACRSRICRASERMNRISAATEADIVEAVQERAPAERVRDRRRRQQA